MPLPLRPRPRSAGPRDRPNRSRTTTPGLAILPAALLAVVSCKPADTTPPVLSVQEIGDTPVIFRDTFDLPVVKALDDRDCCIEDIAIHGEVDEHEIGVYTLHYATRDKAGNADSLTVPIRVIFGKESYLGDSVEDIFWDAVDTCTTGTLAYETTLICDEDALILTNLGGFGPSTRLELLPGGSFNQRVAFDRMVGGLHFQGEGVMASRGDTLDFEWSVSDTVVTDACRTRMVMR